MAPALTCKSLAGSGNVASNPQCSQWLGSNMLWFHQRYQNHFWKTAWFCDLKGLYSSRVSGTSQKHMLTFAYFEDPAHRRRISCKVTRVTTKDIGFLVLFGNISISEVKIVQSSIWYCLRSSQGAAGFSWVSLDLNMLHCCTMAPRGFAPDPSPLERLGKRVVFLAKITAQSQPQRKSALISRIILSPKSLPKLQILWVFQSYSYR